MANFALCLVDSMEKVKNMAWSPDMGLEDIGIRIGLHSGPVTAGILRGGKCMYQLYGATVYEANRIESTGEKGKVHISNETALLLKAGQYRHDIIPRQPLHEDTTQQTYWLCRNKAIRLVSCSDSIDDGSNQPNWLLRSSKSFLLRSGSIGSFKSMKISQLMAVNSFYSDCSSDIKDSDT